MIRSPFFETQAEAWTWLRERPSVFMSSQRIYQTRKLKRWRATWHEMKNEPIFSRDAIMLITQGKE